MPESHFTIEGFEWTARLYRTRNMGGLLVPLHDIMNHDLSAQNVAFDDGMGEASRSMSSPERRYIASTTRPVEVRILSTRHHNAKCKDPRYGSAPTVCTGDAVRNYEYVRW